MGVPVIPKMCSVISIPPALDHVFSCGYGHLKTRGVDCLAQNVCASMVCGGRAVLRNPWESKVGGAELAKFQVCLPIDNGRVEDQLWMKRKKNSPSYSGSRDQSSGYPSSDFRNGSVGPSPSYDGSREVERSVHSRSTE